MTLGDEKVYRGREERYYDGEKKLSRENKVARPDDLQPTTRSVNGLTIFNSLEKSMFSRKFNYLCPFREFIKSKTRPTNSMID